MLFYIEYNLNTKRRVMIFRLTGCSGNTLGRRSQNNRKTTKAVFFRSGLRLWVRGSTWLNVTLCAPSMHSTSYNTACQLSWMMLELPT